MSGSDLTRALVWLSASENLTARGRRLLMEAHGDPACALKGFSASARSLVGEKAYAELRAAADTLDARISRLDALGIAALTQEDADFPDRLKTIPDAPELLYVKGHIRPRPTVAIVGSRRDTRYGREQTQRIARELAEAGVTVVSGLARGIDTAAHRGAVQAKGVTVGVLGCGLDMVYPQENAPLAEEILRLGGALVSEYPPGTAPLPYHFPRRNRMISGLADGVLLIEATLRSGTQSTINHALEQGRTVFALPGNVDAPGSELPLQLLKDGAELCTCASDILTRLRFPECPATVASDSPAGTPPEDDPILAALYREDKTFEELLEETGLPAQTLTARLGLLELDGRVDRLPGRAFALHHK